MYEKEKLTQWRIVTKIHLRYPFNFNRNKVSISSWVLQLLQLSRRQIKDELLHEWQKDYQEMMEVQKLTDFLDWIKNPFRKKPSELDELPKWLR